MKAIFANRLTDIALQDARVTLLTGDYCFGMFDRLKNERPNQYLNCGVAEQSMVGIAAGMAIQGLLPVLYTITPFLLERALEQIKLDVLSQGLKVILVGFDDYPNDGPTHTSVAPLAMCRLIGLNCFEPRTIDEAKDCIETAYIAGPSQFIRLRNAPKQHDHAWNAATPEP